MYQTIMIQGKIRTFIKRNKMNNKTKKGNNQRRIHP